MIKVKGFSLIAITFLIFQIFNPNLGLIAESNRINSDNVTASEEMSQIDINEEKKAAEQQNQIGETDEAINESNEIEILKRTKENFEKDIVTNDVNEKVVQLETTNVSSKKETVNEELLMGENISYLPMAINTPGYYDTDPNAIVVLTQLKGQSTNVHTKPHLLWANGDKVYVAVKATHTLQYMTLNGVQNIKSEVYDPSISIFVDGLEYKPEGLTGNTKDSHWTVYEFNLADLNLDDDGEYPFFVKGIGGGHDVGGHLLFEIPKIDVEANKVWIGGTERPAITLKLIVQVGNEEKKVLRTGEVDGSETPAWTYQWTDVPEYDPYGRKYTFTADEETVPVNYEKSIDGLTVKNIYNPKTIDIIVNKEWIGPAATLVIIQLFADGVDTGQTLELNTDNNWSSLFTGLNKYDDKTGDPIHYTVEEMKIPGYSTKKSGSVEDGFTFTNTNDEKIDIDVSKEWVGPGKESVTIKLFANEEETKELVLNNDNNWSGKFSDLRKYDAETGEEIVYTVKEVEVPGYTTEKTGSVEDGYIFTNINDATINIDVEKRWIGSEESSVTIELISNQEKTGRVILLNEEKNWTDTFKNVRKYDASTGEEINYSVEEVDVPENYDVHITQEDGKFIVTNIARYGSLTVVKVDESNNPLADATFELIDSENIVVGTKTTGEDGAIKFEDLEWGDYKLVETKAPEGYNKLVREMKVTIDGDTLHVTKKVENTPIGWNIPKTGGIGALGFYSVGILFMVVTVWLVIRRRQV